MTDRKVYATIREFKDSKSVLWTVFQDGSFERGNERLDLMRCRLTRSGGTFDDKDKKIAEEINRIEEEYARYRIKDYFYNCGNLLGYELTGWDTDYSKAFIVLKALALQYPPFDEKYGDDEDDDISEDDPRFGKQKVFVEIFVDNPWQKWSEDDERWRILH